MARVSKMAQIQRLFHSTLVPLRWCDQPEEAQWVSEAELEEGRDSLCIDGLPKMSFVGVERGQDLHQHLLDLLAESQSAHHGSTLLISDKPASLQMQMAKLGHPPPIHSLSPDNLHTTAGMRGAVLLLASSEHSLISAIVQSPLTRTILVNVQPNPALTMVLAGHSPALPVTFLSFSHPDLIEAHAASLLFWITALSAHSSPPASPPARQLGFFLTGLKSLAKAAPLIAESSCLHYRAESTGATLLPCFSVILLKEVCSHFCKTINIKGAGLKTRAFNVRRVDSLGKALDGERTFYLSKIVLPSFLSICVPAAELSISSPLTKTRFSATTAAAFEALKTLHIYKAIDDNFVPCVHALEALAGERAQNPEHQYVAHEESEDELDGGDLGTNELGGIVPEELQYKGPWTELSQGLASKTLKDFEFFIYTYDYKTALKGGLGASDGHPAGLKLPIDSLIHAGDLNFFASRASGYSLSILLCKKINGELRDITIPLGDQLCISGKLKFSGSVFLSTEQIEQILDFQVFLFGALNVRPFSIEDYGKAADSIDTSDASEAAGILNSADAEPRGPLGAESDKKSAYLAVFTKNHHARPLCLVSNLKDTLQRYREFSSMPRDFAIALKGTDTADGNCGLPNLGSESQSDWVIDWDLIRYAVDQSGYFSLDKFFDTVQDFIKENQSVFPEPPVFESSPNKPPIAVDYALFSLKRLIAYAPHNGMFYRIRRWQYEMTPQSPFQSKQFPECQSYADYMRLKYKITTANLEKQGLAENRRVENFANIIKWVLFREKSVKAQEHDSLLTSIVIPEMTKLLPLPYAILRVAMLLPRIICDLESQLTIVQYYSGRLRELEPFWPEPFLMIQALTGPSVALDYNYERMEIIGDSILKLYTTMDVFVHHNSAGEGQLSKKRQQRISNSSLYALSKSLELQKYARLTPFFAKNFFPPEIQQLLPLKRLNQKWPFVEQLFDDGLARWSLARALDERVEKRVALFNLYPDGKLVVTEQRSQDLKNIRYKKWAAALPIMTRFGFVIAHKCLADLVESIVCSFYLGPGGVKGAVEFLIHTGTISKTMRSLDDLDPLEVAGRVAGEHVTDSTEYCPPTILMTPSGFEGACSTMAPHAPDENAFPYDAVEKTLRYQFKTRRLLFLACTHVSVDITHCNQRLEWLGDAALDWIVTRYYFEGFSDPEWMTPERITIARQTAVCNEAFGRIIAHHELEKCLRIRSPKLQMEIGAFCEAYRKEEQASFGKDTGEEEPLLKMRRIEPQKLPPAPKALGDLLEGIAGAILVDLHFDIDRFEKTFLPIIRFFLDTRADPYDLPDNPTHQFWHDMRTMKLAGEVEFLYPCTRSFHN